MVARPVAVGDLADGARLRLGPAEDLQRRQAGDDVEEVAGEALQGPELAVGALAGGRARSGP